MKKLKGFTLIELLIVIVILSILATIAIVAFTNQSANAKRTAVLSSLSESVNATNVCLSAAETPKTVTFANMTGWVANGATSAVCGTTNNVSANWTNVKTVGGSTWSYSAGAVDSTGITTSIIATDGSNTVTCTNSGCTKSW